MLWQGQRARYKKPRLVADVLLSSSIMTALSRFRMLPFAYARLSYTFTLGTPTVANRVQLLGQPCETEQRLWRCQAPEATHSAGPRLFVRCDHYVVTLTLFFFEAQSLIRRKALFWLGCPYYTRHNFIMRSTSRHISLFLLSANYMSAEGAYLLSRTFALPCIYTNSIVQACLASCLLVSF